MALDKLVDSTQLDSDLTSVANAIRTKGGTSAELEFPSGFVSAVEAIPSGGGDALKDVGRFALSKLNGPTIETNNLVIDLTGHSVELPAPLFSGVNSITDLKITIKADHFVDPVSGGAFSKGSKKVYSVTFDSQDDYLTPAASFMAETGNLVTSARYLGKPFLVEGNANGNYGFFSRNTGLIEARIVPNRVIHALCCNWSPVLSDATICSIANGLNAESVNTLTLNATPKARCQTLIGTVSQVTEGGETYDFFTQDASGTVTLADFITNTKGWTLA